MTAEERKQQVCVTSLTIILCLKKTSAKLRLPLTTDLFVKDQNTMMQSEDHDKKQICKYSCSSLSQLLHTNVNAVLLFPPSCCKRSLYQFRRFDGLQSYPYLLLAQWFAIICITVQCFIQESIAFFIFWCHFRRDESQHDMNLLL